MINIDLRSLARALGGDVGKGQVLCPGPGHSRADRSLSVKIDPSAPDGFVCHSFADDDPIACKDYVRQKAGFPAFKAYTEETTARPPKSNGTLAREGAGSKRKSAFDISKVIAAQTNATPKGKVVATYNYTDSEGELLYQVVRLEPKSFRQRRPDGHGGWIWNLDGVGRVLYRLPELLRYSDATVFVTEGEKDADRVAELGHCATTVACGKWTSDCVKALAGRDCIILQDMDETGKKKALATAQALHGTAATIRVVALPGLTGEPKLKDVSDWLDHDARNTGKLVDVCLDAPLWTPETAEATTATSDDAAGDHDDGDHAATNKTNSNKATSPRPPWTVPVLPWRDPETIPRRVFLYGHYYARGFVSATIADGGIGKSLLKIAEILACATGLPLLGITPAERSRVLYWNGDDPYVEVERRIHAACQHKLLEERWLFVGTRDQQPLCIAETRGRGGVVVNQDTVVDICSFIHENEIGLACFDPLKSVHRVPENSNDDMDIIGDVFNVIAERTNAAIGLDHHVRKMAFGQTEVTAADARGATALINKVRLSRVLNLMTPALATQAGIKEDDRRRYFRADGGKANIAPPAKATWFKIVSVPCANDEHTPTVTAWTYPNAFDAVTPEHMRRVRTMAADGRYRKDSRAEDWIGRAVAEVLDLDLEDEADRKQVKDILKTWFANGVLDTKIQKDDIRHERAYVVPGNWADEDCVS
jgi:5S rRNA maturation endonuclease (ribonuclease M5)